MLLLFEAMNNSGGIAVSATLHPSTASPRLAAFNQRVVGANERQSNYNETNQNCPASYEYITFRKYSLGRRYGLWRWLAIFTTIMRTYNGNTYFPFHSCSLHALLLGRWPLPEKIRTQAVSSSNCR